MFVKHLDEDDLFNRGFESGSLINLRPESYIYKHVTRDKSRYSMMQVWPRDNIYAYSIMYLEYPNFSMTGTVSRIDEVDELISKYVSDNSLPDELKETLEEKASSFVKDVLGED